VILVLSFHVWMIVHILIRFHTVYRKKVVGRVCSAYVRLCHRYYLGRRVPIAPDLCARISPVPLTHFDMPDGNVAAFCISSVANCSQDHGGAHMFGHSVGSLRLDRTKLVS
jgi:hypothetical protein